MPFWTSISILDKKERAFITRVSEGTIQTMIELDYIINQYSKVKVNKMKPVIRNILRMSVYQLKYMDAVPESAACNEAVKLARKKGFASLSGFVNGVLRNISRNLDQTAYPDETTHTMEYLSVRYSVPEWIAAQWVRDYGMEQTKALLAAFLQGGTGHDPHESAEDHAGCLRGATEKGGRYGCKNPQGRCTGA